MLGLAAFRNHPPEGNQRENIPQAGLPGDTRAGNPLPQLPTHGWFRPAIPRTIPAIVTPSTGMENMAPNKHKNSTWPRLAPLASAVLLMASTGLSTAQAAQPGCPSTMEDAKFATAAQLRQMMSTVVGFGELRNAGSESAEKSIDWLAAEFAKIPGITVRTDAFTLPRWQPTTLNPKGPGRTLELAGGLTVSASAGGSAQKVAFGGAIPFSLATGTAGQSGPLVYIPAGTAITAENARGKVIVRDVPKASLPFIGLAFIAYYVSPDLYPQLLGAFDRPFLGTDGPLAEELIAAGQAGAVGYVSVFNVPREQIAGYYDPHWGTYLKLPAVYVGVDEGEALKKLAASGSSANVSVLAERETVVTRNLFATLPGGSAERVVLNANSDGIGWVQENGTVGILALARYFASLPLQCRPRTIEFTLGSGHLQMSHEGNHAIAKQLDSEYDSGSVAYAMVLEHLGTKELLPYTRWPAVGKTLKFSGLAEPSIWATGTPPLATATVEAVKRRKLARTTVARGIDVPNFSHVPAICGFGGIGGYFNSFLVPVVSTISGPWSLWAPSYGESAVDFERMRTQLLVAGDVILASNKVSRKDIAGPYLKYREQRAAGAAGCTSLLQLAPDEAPEAGSP